MIAEMSVRASQSRRMINDEVERFLLHEARLLDDRRFEEWVDLFTEDGYYWAPAKHEQENPDDEVSIFFDDRQIMEARFRRLRHPRVHVQTPPSRTCHFVTNILVDEADETSGIYRISSCFLMLEHRKERQRVFGGRCEHRLIRHNDTFQIAIKKPTLVNCDAVFDALAIPF